MTETQGRLAGKIALIERGSCTFALKVKNAQLAGAIGAIIQNNQAGLPPMQVEAAAFAWLARACLAQQAGNCPAVTGAAGLRRLGAIHPAHLRARA